MINYKTLDQITAAGAQLVAVTKYLSPEDTKPLLPVLLNHPAVIGVGESRAESLETKKLPRENVHFIGRLQSRKFPQIVHQAGVIHSLDNLSHAEKLNKLCIQSNLLIKIFVQINIVNDPLKGGIAAHELPEFINEIKELGNLEIIGLSAMGGDNFQDLIDLRDTHLKRGLTSMGTSRDYEAALVAGIDVVRVGKALFT